MPNWADDEGRFWWTPPGGTWLDEVEIPHAPVTRPAGCSCAMCSTPEPPREPDLTDAEVAAFFAASRRRRAGS